MPRRYRVELTEQAEVDLQELYDYIAEVSSRPVAAGYLLRLKRTIDSLELFPKRGTQRDDLQPGVRIIGFERRIAILFVVSNDVVRIHGVLYGGQELEGRFGDDMA